MDYKPFVTRGLRSADELPLSNASNPLSDSHFGRGVLANLFADAPASSFFTDASGHRSPRVLFAVLLTVFLMVLLRKTFIANHHLTDFSGPWWAAYTRLWLCKALSSAESAQLFVDTNKKYGSVARVGPNHLITDDPELTRRILAVGTKWRRGPWFDAIRIDPRVTNIVSERDPSIHNAMRHRMSAGYAGKDIRGLEEAVNERVSEFVSLIEKNWLSTSERTKPFDIAKRIQFFTIDTITHLCFGKPMGFVQSDSDKHNFIATIEQQLPIVQHFSVILSFNTALKWASAIPLLRKFVVPSSADKSGIGVIMGVSIAPEFLFRLANTD